MSDARSPLPALLTLTLGLGLLFAACAPARSLPCENDGDCTKASSSFRYCAEHVCVECVGDADCGSKSVCDHGKCYEKQRCPSGTDFREGKCVPE
jgi:hypothetical protein